MIEIMQGCLKGLGALPEKTLDLVTAIKVKPLNAPDGYWPKEPREPFDYDIKIVLNDEKPLIHLPDRQTTTVRSTVSCGSSDADLPLVDRIGKEVENLITTGISSHSQFLRARADFWARSVPEREAV